MEGGELFAKKWRDVRANMHNASRRLYANGMQQHWEGAVDAECSGALSQIGSGQLKRRESTLANACRAA